MIFIGLFYEKYGFCLRLKDKFIYERMIPKNEKISYRLKTDYMGDGGGLNFDL